MIRRIPCGLVLLAVACGGEGGRDAAGADGRGDGPEADVRCAVPAGADPSVGPAVPWPGWRCERYPYPLAAPRDVFRSSSGELYLTELGAGRIVRFTATGFVTVASGLASPIGLREDGAGSLLVTEETRASLARVDPGSGARSLVAEGLDAVTYLTLGPDGAAYVSSFRTVSAPGTGVVHRVDLASGAASPFATELGVPEGCLFDEAGRLVVADWFLPATVRRFPVGGGAAGASEVLADGFEHVYGLASDGSGGFFAGDHGGRIVRILADGSREVWLEGIGRPGGIAVDPDGTIWVAEFVDFEATGYLLRLVSASL